MALRLLSRRKPSRDAACIIPDLASGLDPLGNGRSNAPGPDYKCQTKLGPVHVRSSSRRRLPARAAHGPPRALSTGLTDPKWRLLSPAPLNEKPRITYTRGPIAFWRGRLRVETAERTSRLRVPASQTWTGEPFQFEPSILVENCVSKILDTQSSGATLQPTFGIGAFRGSVPSHRLSLVSLHE